MMMWEAKVLTVRRVRAHLTEADVDRGRISRRDRFGNCSADIWAKFAASRGRLAPVDRERIQLAQVLVEDVAHFIARAGASVNSQDTVVLRPGAKPNKAPVLQIVYPKLGHELVGPEGGKWCLRCRVRSPSKAECPGSVVSRAVEANRRLLSDGLDGHKLVRFETDLALDCRNYAVVGCQVCGAATSLQLKSLSRPCTKPGVHGMRAIRALEGGFVPHVKGAKVPTKVVALAP